MNWQLSLVEWFENVACAEAFDAGMRVGRE